MRSLFWLQQSNATVDPTTVLKAAAENVREEALQSFPICTALSPSAKSLKIPVNSTNPKCFNRDVIFDTYSHLFLKSFAKQILFHSHEPEASLCLCMFQIHSNVQNVLGLFSFYNSCIQLPVHFRYANIHTDGWKKSDF